MGALCPNFKEDFNYEKKQIIVMGIGFGTGF